jgi:hypothetical protein
LSAPEGVSAKLHRQIVGVVIKVLGKSFGGYRGRKRQHSGWQKNYPTEIPHCSFTKKVA